MSNGDRKNHYRALEGMYLSAPINEPLDIQVAIDDGHCEILLETTPQMWHAALAVHGSVFFKLLDDAAFFAAASKIPDAFVLTASFHLEFLRPLVEGQVRAVGDIRKAGKNLLFADAVVYDENQKEIAAGQGTFARSEIPLSADMGYHLGPRD
jgi:uncharacterized protein (TIGR00369 family)